MLELEDPLDSPQFDPIAYINQNFPTESSLDGLDTFIVGITSQISTLDEEISRAVHTQSVAGKQASKDINHAQESIVELFEKIADIKTKSSQSERMVNEICHDIKKLDYAKTHLQSSITSLKRLQMLITAVGQLELLAQEYQYREAANLLDAVKQLLTHFDRYMSIPLISEIQDRVDNIQTSLKIHVHTSFREIGQILETVADVSAVIGDLPGGMKHLSDSCLVVDALGAAARKELLEEFVQLQLEPYERLFGPDRPHFSLDQVDRRWAWFKRLLKMVDVKFQNVCPPHWRLPLRLCLEFTERTKEHIVQVLTVLESKDQMDVHALLKALQTTLKFEQEMASRFECPTPTLFPPPGIAAVTESQGEMERRLIYQDKLMYVPTNHEKEIGDDELEIKFLKNAQISIGAGMSGVFDKFMGSYVLLERQNLEELLQRLGQDEDSTGDGDQAFGNVYSSASSMFVFIKNSIKRCTALSNGLTFVALCKEFKTCMQQYSEMLRNRCPLPITVSASPYFSAVNNSSFGNLSSTDFPRGVGAPVPVIAAPVVYRISPGGEAAICYLMNTGDYCAETVSQLEGIIKLKMAPKFVDRVDLNSEVDVFVDLVAYSLKVLVSGIMERLEGTFRAMGGINWAGSEQIGEESPYINQFSLILIEAMTKIREALSSSYITSFCSKLATEILQKYLDIILRQKRISETGSQQLLLDAYNIKTLLLHLHSLDSGGGDQHPEPLLI